VYLVQRYGCRNFDKNELATAPSYSLPMLVRWWRSGFLGNMRVPNVRYDILLNTTPNKTPTRMMLVNGKEMRDDVC